MRVLVASLLVGGLFVGRSAFAADAPAPTAEQIEAAVVADEKKSVQPAATATTPADGSADADAPPPLPRHKGVVLESRLGALAFLGQFGKVAPTAPWVQLTGGYELFNWLLFFGEAELALTDTSVATDPTKTRAFPIFGFGGGARVTVHVTDRVAAFAQGSLGAMKADVTTNAFGALGFKDAESLGLYVGGRLGVEWYQIDRHLALGLGVGVRDAKGFAKSGPASDTPLMLDAGLALRYTF